MIHQYSGRNTAIQVLGKTSLPGNAVPGRESGMDLRFVDIGKIIELFLMTARCLPKLADFQLPGSTGEFEYAMGMMVAVEPLRFGSV
jgi:hypothetical protein